MGADGELAASSKVFCPASGKGRVPGERARLGKANLASAQTGSSRNIRSPHPATNLAMHPMTLYKAF